MLEISFLLTFFATSVIMLITSDLRFLLVVSSVRNNSWLILSSLVSQGFMLLFLCVYSMTLYAVLSRFGSSAIPLTSFFLVVGIIALSGLPPFPLFFLKSFLVLSVFSGFPVILLFLALAALALCAYAQSTFSLLVFSFSSLVKQLT
jgi:formate hydrogenlyase subunit 3/multisubunit Na+/H+ antiporter MnhD subunit